MSQIKYILTEFKRLFTKKSVLFSVITALLVPLVYAMIMLSPKWGPQDNIDNIAVAVVNNDKGAEQEGEVLNVGEQLVENLKANPTLGWDFVSSKEAKKGMDDMKYYMTIEVPEDFSEKVITVMDEKPERPELKYTQNEGLHYMAAQVTDRAKDTIKEELSSEITKTYVQNVVDQLGEVGTGFLDAADGADQINDGSNQLKDGSNEMLTSLTEKSGDIGRLAEGSKALNAGTYDLLTNLNNKYPDISRLAQGANDLSDGATRLKSGTGELSDGAGKLKAGTGDLKAGTGELKAGAGKLKTGTDDLKAGTGQLQAGTGDLKSGTGELKAGTGELKAGAGKLKAGTDELQSGVGELKSGMGDLRAGAGELQAGSNELKEGSSRLRGGSIQLRDGSETLKQGITGELAPGVAELTAGVKQAQEGVNDTIASMRNLQESLQFLSTLDKEHPAYDGIFNEVLTQLNAGLEEAPQKQADFERLVAGANQLQEKTQQGSALYNGVIELNEGLNDLSAGAAELDEGVGRLNAGAGELADGAAQLDEGAGKLASGASELNAGASELSAGASELNTGASQLDAGATALNKGATDLNEGATALNTGASDLDNGVGQLSAGASELDEGAGQLNAGATELNEGAGELSDGANQVADGNQTVKSGWVQLQDGASQLHDGSTQIKDGNATVETGWGALTDGVTQIDDGLSQVVDGSAELHEGLEGGAEQVGGLDPQEENILMFAEPVVLDGEVINSFPFYRDANAPYIITLALFVGVLAMSFAVPYRQPAILPPTALAWYTGKLTKLGALAILQALIISLYSLFVLKIQVHSSLLFILFSIWVSLTFLMIILFLVVLAGNIGRFIALAFAVIQLSTTGSDLPIHMLPEGLRNLSVFLPFTYSIDGFKNVITLGSTANVWANIAILFVYFATFAILAGVVYFVRYRRLHKEEVHEEEIPDAAL